MIRSVVLKNFARFRKEQKIEFKNGTYYFVGKNGSGKSTVFEAIRRCLSSQASSSYSNIGVEDNDTYVVCRFDVPSATGKRDENRTTIFSCLFHFAPDHHETNYKLAVSTVGSSDDNIKCGLDKIDGGDKGQLKIRPVRVTEQKVKSLYQMLKSDIDIQGIISVIKKCKDDLQEECKEGNTTECDGILSVLHQHVVCLFEKRGVTPIHWSMSRKEKSTWRDQDRDEIISWWFEKRDERSREEIDEEAKIFETITSSKDFSFSLEEGNIMVTERNFKWNFLKTPGGLVEAKECSIILGSSQFHTLCLEEPTRSMHPQMVQRFRDYVLPSMPTKEKVVLIATHNPSLITAKSVANTFLFRKQDEMDEIVCNILPGSSLSKEMKAKKTLTDSHISKLFFSSRVIFVEGENDRIFIKTLFEKIVEGCLHFQRAFKILYPQDTSPTSGIKRKSADVSAEGCIGSEEAECVLNLLRRFIRGMDVVQMDGSTKVAVLKKACNTLQLKHYFLLDKDAENQVVKKMVEIEAGSDDPEVMKNSLRSKGIFVWKDGTLEEMVNSLIRKCEISTETESEKPDKRPRVEEETVKEETFHYELKKYLQAIQNRGLSQDKVKTLFQQENINVMSTKKKLKPRDKLFGNPKLTDENIYNGMDIILALCHKKDDDLVQFIQFLSDCQAKPMRCFHAPK